MNTCSLPASRTHNITVTPIVEKGLASSRASTKQSSLEALLLYIEIYKADPIIEDLILALSNKQPKIIAATLTALTAIYHAYGVKIVDPKPTLKVLPKIFGHADKNVRAEATKLVVELYRWLREAMKPLFWNDLKPVQQQDLEKMFVEVEKEEPPKQDRLIRSQQEAKAAASTDVGAEDGADGGYEAEDEPAGVDAFDLAEPVDVLKEIPGNFLESLASAKWKERKDALDAFFAIANVPRIKDGPYDEVITAFAKCMKDTNVGVVAVAANCVEALAKGLRKAFSKYRSRIMAPMLDRLKEKKAAITEALGSALDAVFASTSLSDCLEEILEFMKHKNPQIKLESLRFLIRCLKTTREVPSKPETKSIADAATKLLTESTEITRSGGAEILGTLMKIMGERVMAQYLEGLDDIRKTKIKEYFDAAEVKAKDKPKLVAPPPKAAPLPQKKIAGKKPTLGVKKPLPAARLATTQAEEPSPEPVQQKPALSRNIGSKLSGPPKPTPVASAGGLKLQKRLAGPGSVAGSSLSSPKRTISSDDFIDEPTPAPKIGLSGRGLASRPLGKPAPNLSEPAASQTTSIAASERAELEDARAEKERLQRLTDDLRTEKSKLLSQISELQNLNAQLIEDHTRDVLSIKAKETQLVRARSDAEMAEQTVQLQQRELDRLKRELANRGTVGDGGTATESDGNDSIYLDAGMNGSTVSHGSLPDRSKTATSTTNHGGNPTSGSHETGHQLARQYMTSPSEEKENGSLEGLGGETKGLRRMVTSPPDGRIRAGYGDGRRGGRGEEAVPVEGLSRTAEVTNLLKARIEQMRVGSL